MCVDTFMFGSCCAHNSTQNTLLPPQQQHHSNKPQILYTHSSSSPSQSQNSHSNNYIKPTKPLSHYISTSRPKPNRIFYSHQQASNSTRSSLATPSPTLETSTNQKPDHSWRISTPPPRHSIRPMNTEDEFTLQANLIYTKPGWQMTTEPAFITSNHSTQQGEVSGLLNWQLTTESSIITKQKKPTKTKNKPTKKPVQSVPDKYFTKYSFKPTKPTTTKRHSIRPMNTEDEFTLQANLIYTKPGWQMTTEPAFITSNHSTQQGEVSGLLNWQLTTESSIITKQKKPTKTKNKPTKKPVQSVPDKYFTKYSFKPTKPTTTKRKKSQLEYDHVDPHDSACGVPQMFTKPQTRIVGGKNAPFGRWPWQVSVRRTSFFGFSSTHRCGGAVLNENWMATAGHCVDDLLTSQIRIRVGEYDFSNIQEQLPYVERGVSQKIVHPKYNYFTYEYDLALVQVDKPLEFLPHISPICLPASNDLLIGENATVTGWGRLSEGGTLPSVLQEVQVPIVSNDRCKSMFLRAGRHEFIPDIFLCAGYEGGGQDSCQGDSGGPLQVKGKDGKYFLAGIISWGIGCAEANLPGVCTRISKFVPWILKIVT
uniref:Serine proteinase stubble n=1 Tax=Diabrotica virgifera virgifera TaxID=50390 RepID=A0A6P7G9I6_DIAVI